eukprot:2682827-Karenia_brevis.AAC.1
MYNFQRVTPLSMPWPAKDAEIYEEACRKCEIVVEFESESVWADVRASLRSDKRDQGSRGLALQMGFPQLGLKA